MHNMFSTVNFLGETNTINLFAFCNLNICGFYVVSGVPIDMLKIILLFH